ncbi:MAG: hypothetical protein JWL87_145 [Candidatus Adlerbacteria bacterium]|nr:hypothetical protein [Candidatus Adlerbacteria bacterium]
MKSTLTKSLLALGALAALGGGAGMATLASAQTVDAATAVTTTTDTSASAQSQRSPHMGGHVGHNGIKEELLTGDAAARVTAAALAAVPGGTVERVENDAEGAAYEAHMTKADGSRVTVKFDQNYAVTATETGRHGRGTPRVQ